MIRAEIGLKTGDGTVHDYRIDRGRLTKRYGAGGVVVLERDSTAKTRLPVSSSARVLLNGKLVGVRALRAGMQVAVPRDGNLPADVVYAAAKNAPAIPRASVQYWLGNRMFKAEVASKTPDGVLHDYLLDRGRVRQVGPYSLTLRELDGTTATFTVSAAVRVKLNGKTASFAQLRKGMTAVVLRDGDKPADQVWATGK